MSKVDEGMTHLARVKAQAEVLVPLIKRLEVELGHARARALAAEVISGYYRQMAEQWLRECEGDTLKTFVRFGGESSAGQAITGEASAGQPGEYNFDVTACQYARYFNELGEPELGALLVCSGDHDIADVLGVGLGRSTTIMEGGSRCDFRWRFPTPPQHAHQDG